MHTLKEQKADSIIGVSFDLSKTRTGVCVWDAQRPTMVLSWTFQDTYDVGHTLASFRNLLPGVIPPAHGVGWVAFEDVRPINKHHSELHFGMSGVLAEICYRNETPLLRATSTEIKKLLTGSGKATKDDMVVSAREKFPYLNVQNHDEADAVAVGLAAVSKILWDKPLDAETYRPAPF